MNVANVNAAEILGALGITSKCYGTIRASDLAKRISAFKGPDPAFPASEDGRVIFGGRTEGYLGERFAKLLNICKQAGDLGMIEWG
jgi:hypothetical protein